MAQPSVAVYNIDWGLYPKDAENPRALRAAVPLEAGVITQVNLGTELDREQVSNTQTIYIDNSDGANAVVIAASKSQHTLKVPAGSQAFLPWMWGDDNVLTITRADAGTLPIYFINMPMPAVVWSGTAAGSIVTVAGGVITLDGPFGQELMAASIPVVIASDQSAIPTTGTSANNKVDVELIGGEAIIADDAAAGANLDTLPVGGKAVSAVGSYTGGDRVMTNFNLQGGLFVGGAVGDDSPAGGTYPIAIGGIAVNSIPGYTAGDRTQAIFDVSGNLKVYATGNLVTAADSVGNNAVVTLGAYNNATQSTVRPMLVGNYVFNGTSWDRARGDINGAYVSQMGGSTGTRSSVANATSDTLLLAANAARKGAQIFNDDTAATLKIGLGTTAVSATSFTASIPPGGYYEVPQNFLGQIRGIASAATGNARITELT